MKTFFKIPTLLYLLSCVGSFWITTVMYPYSVYYNDVFVPQLIDQSFADFLALIGIGAALGTALFILLSLLSIAGKPLGLHKNLIVYFLFHFAVCSAFAVGVDLLFGFIKFEPYWIYVLLGFIPAILCSIIHSYEMSHAKRHENDTKNA